MTKVDETSWKIYGNFDGDLDCPECGASNFIKKDSTIAIKPTITTCEECGWKHKRPPTG